MSIGSSSDPLSSLLAAYPCGTILLRDSLAASGHFLLPWLTAACLKQGQKVCSVSPADGEFGLPGLGAWLCSSSSSSSGRMLLELKTGPAHVSDLFL
jgi:hypothetical protein